MSICEHMIESCASSQQISSDEKLRNIQNELIWGLTYRNYKENEKNKPMAPMHSPMNIPFELCRAEMFLKHGKKAARPRVAPEPEKKDDGSAERGSGEIVKRPQKRKIPIEKPTLLDRNVWSQSKYMDFLSIPNPKFYDEPKTKRYKKRCELEPCPPRFVQLAVPNKRRVFANWKEYAHFLPTEMLLRFEEILHTDQNLEPREARYYYKKIDKLKRKELKKKRRKEKKEKLMKEKDSNWLRAQIEMTAAVIVEYIQDEPIFTLNYKQMLLSDGILDRLEKTNTMKKPSRKTKNNYKKTLIEVSDKFAIWIDTLTRFVDVQAIESDTDIPPVSIPSLTGEGEGESEGESDYESSEEDEEEGSLRLFEPTEAMWGEDGEALMEDIFRPGEGEGAAEIDAMLTNLDRDTLEKLIRILSNCSDDFLNGAIDEEKMPGTKYRNILDRLKAIRDCLAVTEGGKSFLEQVLIDWAIRNDPDSVTDDILWKIHEVACVLGDIPSKRSDLGDDWVVVDRPDEGDDGGEKADRTAEGKDDKGEGGAAAAGAGAADEGIAGGGTAGGAPTDSEVVVGDLIDSATPGETTPGETTPGETTPGETVPEGERPAGEDLDNLEGTRAEKKPEQEGQAGEVSEGDTPTSAVSTEGGGEGKEGAGSRSTFLEDFGITEADGEVTDQEGLSEFEGEEGVEAYGAALGDERQVAAAGEVTPTTAEEEEEQRALAAKESSAIAVPPAKETETAAGDGEVSRLDGRVIKGHKPPKVFEHSPDTVCCLSLKTWAVWLLEITHNAHNWTQWMSSVIQKVREYAAIVRGDVKEANGQVKVLRKAEWRKFIAETEESVVAWRQYSAHVKELSQSIVDSFHDKKVNCCPKCLEDHLIPNVVVAHDTLQALTEAISCAAYWQRCLDALVEKACILARPKEGMDTLVVSSEEESDGDADIEEVEAKGEDSGESVYEIEGLETASIKENPIET